MGVRALPARLSAALMVVFVAVAAGYQWTWALLFAGASDLCGA
jgi:hypothetical protein